MNNMSKWGKHIALFALGLSAVGSLNAPATAGAAPQTTNIIQASESKGNLQLAQAQTLVGQCRAAKERIFVYSQRSNTSQTVRTLAPYEQITLAEEGTDGFIAISSPEKGYVEVKDLTSCSGGVAANPAPAQTSSSSRCRVVTYNGTEGLAIRKGPDKTAARVGGVYAGNRVTLKNNPPSYTVDGEKRSWVEISAPTAGWISYGYPSSNSTNVGACS